MKLKFYITVLILSVAAFLFSTCSREAHPPQVTATDSLDQQLVAQVAADPDFVYIAYALDKDYLQLRIAVYAKDSIDYKERAKQIQRVARFFFYYGHKLQEKYHLRNTTAYLQAADGLYRQRNTLSFIIPDITVRKAITDSVVNSSDRPIVTMSGAHERADIGSGFTTCAPGLVYNPEILMCDWPENVPDGNPYFYQDPETGEINPLPPVTVVSSCYDDLTSTVFSFLKMAYPCGYSAVFGNTLPVDVGGYMQSHPKAVSCFDNISQYQDAVRMADMGCGQNTGGGMGGGPGGGEPDDPCAKAKPMADKATALAAKGVYTNALSNIKAAATADGHEHNINFNQDANGNITSSSMSNGDGTSVTSGGITSNSIASLHNHVDGRPPSPGDIYSLIEINGMHNNYKTKFVTTGNTVYALVITDTALANAFASDYPEYVPPVGQGGSPGFPDEINEKWSPIFFGNPPLASEETATAYILDEYNSGVALLKQNPDGSFSKLGAVKSGDGDNTTYMETNCNN